MPARSARLVAGERSRDHRGGGDEHDRGAGRRFPGELLLEDFGAVEEGKVIGSAPRPVERLVGIVRAELDAAVGSEKRRADRAAKVEIEAGGLAPVGRLADQAWARDAAAADDAVGLDAVDDGSGMGGQAPRDQEGEGEGEKQHRGLRPFSAKRGSACPWAKTRGRLESRCVHAEAAKLGRKNLKPRHKLPQL